MNFNNIGRDNSRVKDTTQFLWNPKPQFQQTHIVSWNCFSQLHNFSNFLREKIILLFQICWIYKSFAKILVYPVLIVIVKDKKICNNNQFGD